MVKKAKTYKIILSSVLLIVMIGSFFFVLLDDVDAHVRVRGYYRKDGTYVRPHYRSNPDGNPYNNWSFPGNYNPNTGRISPGNPSTYLRNYCKKSPNNPYCSGHRHNSSIISVLSKPSRHYPPPVSAYRIYKVPGTLTVWELSYWQRGGFGTRRGFANPQAFINRYGGWGWHFIKPISWSELNKYQVFGIYK